MGKTNKVNLILAKWLKNIIFYMSYHKYTYILNECTLCGSGILQQCIPRVAQNINIFTNNFSTPLLNVLIGT